MKISPIFYTKILKRGSSLSPGSDSGSSGLYNQLLARSITKSISQVIMITRGNPSLFMAAIRLLFTQKGAARRRKALEAEGVQVPAVVMISLTHRCNLACHGCYMRSLHPVSSSEMSNDQLKNLVSQCVDLGVSFLVIAGGEPLVRKDDILLLTRVFPSMTFAVFTNGLLIDDVSAAECGKLKNLVPIISIEGDEEATDSRRCKGAYQATLRAFSLLHKNSVFFGCSITVTRKNYADVTSDRFVQEMITLGCRLIAYVEFVPIDESTSDLVISDTQHQDLNHLLTGFSNRYSALFLGFPGDEEIFGGCLAAGRGFLHISPSGDLEPCPAAPFSDVNVTKMPLRDALNSNLLFRIRSHHHMLSESGGGCALWANRGWVASLMTLDQETGGNPP